MLAGTSGAGSVATSAAAGCAVNCPCGAVRISGSPGCLGIAGGGAASAASGEAVPTEPGPAVPGPGRRAGHLRAGYLRSGY